MNFKIKNYELNQSKGLKLKFNITNKIFLKEKKYFFDNASVSDK